MDEVSSKMVDNNKVEAFVDKVAADTSGLAVTILVPQL